MSSSARDHAFAAVQSEILEERAAALGKAGRKVERAMARCDELRAAIVATEDDVDRDALRSEYRDERAAFDEALWAYRVHREAIGLHDHRWVHRIYVRPPSISSAP